MRTLVHLSDLHFGRVDHTLLEPLRRTVCSLNPSVLVVSGDLTQRARASQFEAARAFLDTLPKPQIVVPGNHDVPLYNVFARFFGGLSRYRRYMSRDLEPTYIDEEIAVTTLPVLRPLVGFHKEEITLDAQRIGTYQTSILPDEDCCTLFTPRYPTTGARPGEADFAEANLDVVGLVRRAVEEASVEEFRFPMLNLARETADTDLLERAHRADKAGDDA